MTKPLNDVWALCRIATNALVKSFRQNAIFKVNGAAKWEVGESWGGVNEGRGKQKFNMGL